MSKDLNMDMSALPGANGLARAAALAAAAALPDPDPVPTVSYRSEGRVLVVGCAADVVRWTDTIPAPLVASMAFIRTHEDIALAGHLGAFFARWRNGSATLEGTFDLVLDLCDPPLLNRADPPFGYFAPAPAEEARAAAIGELSAMTGLFEKPKYFAYKERTCAHSRNRKTGCTACIDICSARAIASDGDKIKVDPYLCKGCGACTTVCPSGAISYAYPGAAYTGARLRTLLAAYASAGGTDPVLVFHAEEGRALLEADPLPDHAIAIELHHIASVGLEVWLSAIAYGATGIVLLATGRESPAYLDALRGQMTIAQTVLRELGYAGRHFALSTGTIAALPKGEVPQARATYHVANDKRNTLDFALTHLHTHAPFQPQDIGLPPGAPFGQARVDSTRCSLCMSCVGVCPSSALMDSPSHPRLSFVEQNCIQCGLCAATCPEDAITLVPRLTFTPERRQAVVVHETQPFNCISCGKPFGTLLMVERMLERLAGHAAFSAHPERLKMCGDCRVVAMMQSSAPPSI
ncbi:4Fe-4S dicluster domain-containing protein [Massilia arenosa]|uniref:4Fe-4S dicluster domain-containing protein n=1 Tax=Zemynaea arenosa TaxID=2561931 RepID=A0A4Y9SV17_9BURK|nr:4Fe-4S dicluster domain-containing protein [Massilia arenosa]TFW29347.1 4Fe-4S dicluster domain-containing protein [Massilia arenosa]